MKVFSPFLKGDTTTSGSLNVPQHPTSSAIINPTTGSLYHDTTDNVLKVYTGTQWQIVGEQEVTTPPDTSINYLLVAGGGGGGAGITGDVGGGGGAGGLLSSSLENVLSGSTFTVTVGAGGSGGGSNTNNGGTTGDDSVISSTTITTLTSNGGGGGGGNSGPGLDGGSGGGGTRDGDANNSSIGGSGTVGQGNDGGTGNGSTNAPGGGGAATAGGSTSAGDGLQSNIDGNNYFWAGGGGGAVTNGGIGGGGAGGRTSTGGGSAINPGEDSVGDNGGNGGANTGGGGGGGVNVDDAGGSGGSGIAIFSYDSGSFTAAGGIVGDAGNGRKYNQFNSSGTFKVGSTSDFGIVTDSLQIHLDAGNFASRGTSTWTDLTSNGYDSTLVSSPSLGQNFYYDFDGSADYATFSSAAHTAISSHTQGTVECWVNGDSFTSGTSRKTIFGTGHSSQTDRWCVLRVHVNNYLQMSINADGVATGCYTTSVLPSTNTWYHFAITYNGASFAAYYNGISQSITTDGAGWFNSVGSDTLQLGAMDRGTSGNNYDPWDGKIAQLRVYSKGLSAAEVLQNYNATKTNFI